MIIPAWKCEIFKCFSAPLKPCQDATSSGLKQLKLHWSAGLLLNHDCSGANSSPADKIANFHFDDVAPAQFTVDRQIEQGTIACSLFAVEPKSDSPDLLWLEGSFASNQPSGIPRTPFFDAWVKF